MELTHIEDRFVDINGKFLTSSFDIREKLEKTKAIVFDWDGVFNDGFKNTTHSSGFSEIDTLGVAMLRFGFKLARDLKVKTAIITGEKNEACITWAKREGIDSVYTYSKNKEKALYHFCDRNNLTPSEVIYFFDDVLDVPVAKKVGIRMAVGRKSNPFFTEYLEKNHLVDYFSGCSGENHAVREFSELILALLEKPFEVIEERATYSEKYKSFKNEIKQISTHIFAFNENDEVEDANY